MRWQRCSQIGSRSLAIKNDGDSNVKEIEFKQDELAEIQTRLSALSGLIGESDLVCPKCGDPLTGHEVYTIYGNDEREALLEFVEYECGLSIDGNGREVSRCWLSIHKRPD